MIFTRDGAGRIIEIRDPDDNTVSYEYDVAGNLVSVTDPDTNIMRFTYDDLGAWFRPATAPTHGSASMILSVVLRSSPSQMAALSAMDTTLAGGKRG